MANYQTSQDLVQAVLSVCGELTDGTSGYQADALTYLNLAYKNVLAGGNLYGIDVAEPWAWALAKRPLNFILKPAIQNVSVTCTQQSYNITFSAAPTDVTGANISVQGWFINIDSRDEWFQITQHTSGTTTAQIDVPYTEASLTAATCNIVQFEYDLIDDSIVVDSYNCYLDFNASTGASFTTVLTNGIYTPADFATLVQTGMNASATGLQTFTVAWNSITRLFTVSSSAVFQLSFASGTYAQNSASCLLGFDVLDASGGSSYTGTYPLNAINRLTAPMACYRQTSYYPVNGWSSPKDEGKIFELSQNAFLREFPLRYTRSMVPDRFCVTRTTASGIVTVRMNAYMSDLQTKVEVGYIPKLRALQYNTASIPVVPEEHREFLVHSAAARLMQDKVDNRRPEREKMAMASLQALVHANRKQLSLAGNNYGKLIPRTGQTQNRRWIIS